MGSKRWREGRLGQLDRTRADRSPRAVGVSNEKRAVLSDAVRPARDRSQQATASKPVACTERSELDRIEPLAGGVERTQPCRHGSFEHLGGEVGQPIG
jgi:hypothetical protein